MRRDRFCASAARANGKTLAVLDFVPDVRWDCPGPSNYPASWRELSEYPREFPGTKECRHIHHLESQYDRAGGDASCICRRAGMGGLSKIAIKQIFVVISFSGICADARAHVRARNHPWYCRRLRAVSLPDAFMEIGPHIL